MKSLQETITESLKEVFPNMVIGDSGFLIWLKTFERIRKDGKPIVNYETFYRGYRLDYGGQNFSTVKDLQHAVNNTIVSINQHSKYGHIPEKPLPKQNKDGTYIMPK